MAGSIATEENGRFFNRFYFAHPNGDYSTYDKRHLFSFAGEHKKYEAGQERVIVDYLGFRILLQVCYDLRFPVFSRNRNDYDMIIYVANWPVQRIEAWNTLLKARAIENACYVAGVNRVGDDPFCQYNGSSVLLDYMGKEIVAATCGKEEVVLTTIEKEPLMAFRKKFPVLNDGDEFEIKAP
jgi:Predicted amidohydrolase